MFLGTRDGELISLRTEDGEVWRTQMSSEVLAPAAVGDGQVFAMSLDGRLTALSLSDGARNWSYDTQVPVLTLRGTSTPVYSDPMVFMSFAGGRLTALRGENGEVIWEHVVALPSGRSELERISDLDASPLVTPAGAFIASYQGAIKSLRLLDGSVQWERPVSTFSELAEGCSQIYNTDEEGIIRAFDQVSGNGVWEQGGLIRQGVTGPAVFGPWLAVGDFEGYVHLFAQSDSRPVARLKVDGDGIRNSPVAIDDRLIVQGNGGRLGVYRFSAASAEVEFAAMARVIALVGRPNVGKSTLFNRLTRSRDALVADFPGLTRDRQYGLARLDDGPCIVIDTGGLSRRGSRH